MGRGSSTGKALSSRDCKVPPIGMKLFLREHFHYGITGCGVFKAGIQNWKGFCIKINCSQMKLLNFENWTNGEPQ